MEKSKIHPNGEKKSSKNLIKSDLIPVDTFGGKVQIRWDQNASLTPMGQLPFFIEYLKLSGLFNRWITSCPIHYASGNAPKIRDVLGTILLSVLSGHKKIWSQLRFLCKT